MMKEGHLWSGGVRRWPTFSAVHRRRTTPLTAESYFNATCTLDSACSPSQRLPQLGAETKAASFPS